MDALFEPSVLAAVADQLDRAFPDALPPVRSEDPAVVSAAYWRRLGQRDVVNHLRAAAAAATEE